jgi:hypothetical protein
MKKRKAIGPVNLLLLVIAVGLLLFSGIGGARAAMNYYSRFQISLLTTHQVL